MRPLSLAAAALFLLAGPARAEDESTLAALKSFSADLARTDASPPRDALLSAVVERIVQAEGEKPERREAAAKDAVPGLNATAVDAERSPALPRETAAAIRRGMAEVNLKAGDYDAARGFASRAIELDPKDRDAYVQRSHAGSGQRRFDAARSDASQAISLDPRGADGWRARAMANYGLGDFLQASEDARRALALDSQDRTSFAILKLTEGRTIKAMDMDALKRRAAGEIVGDYHAMVQQLNQAESRRRVVEPYRGPRDAAPSEPTPAEAAHKHVRAAAGSLSAKDYAAAVEAADRALERDPGNTTAYYYRAAALNLAGRYDEALRDASNALALNADDAPAHDARAFAFNHLGRYRDAVADSHHSLEINPSNPYAFANLGYSHERMGDLAGMLRNLKSAAALNAQFQPVYHDAAARHGLEVEPLSGDGSAARARERKARAAAKRRQFAFVVGSSTVGGLLIALGFLHLLAGAKRPDEPLRASDRLVSTPKRIEAAFEITRTVGMGGMGVVYEAVDRALQRPVAIKVVREELKRDPRAKERFLAEARTVAALQHPAIVAIHQIVDDATGFYLVFEFVEGRTLHDVLADRGRLPLDEAKAVLKQVCAALDYAHRHRVVHRDLKPANVMLSGDGAVKVMDFGISRHVLDAAPPEMAEGRTGTPEYMAPEQRYGVVRPESDVFSLGACLYEMVTGRRPFAGATGAFAAGDYVKATAAAPGLPPSIDALLDAALHPDPERRVRSARDFWSLLERVGAEPAAA